MPINFRLISEPSSLAIEYPNLDSVQYVSPRGSDSNDGLSPGNAKLTIPAALTVLTANGGGTLELGGGTFILPQTIIPSFVHLRGRGGGRSIITCPDATTTSFVFFQLNNGTEHVEISGVKFDGKRTATWGTQYGEEDVPATPQVGIQINSGTSDIRIHDCEFYDIFYDGIWIRVDAGNPIKQGISIHNNVFRQCAYGVTIERVNDIQVDHNLFVACRRWATRQNFDTVTKCSISDNIIDGFQPGGVTRAAEGIGSGGGGTLYDKIAIVGNIVHGCDYGIRQNLTVDTMTRAVIESNIVQDCSEGIVSNGNRFAIVGNVVGKCDGRGINLGTAASLFNDSIVANNEVEETCLTLTNASAIAAAIYLRGISAGSKSNGNIISNNRIKQTTAGKVRFGVFCATNVDDNEVLGNSLNGDFVFPVFCTDVGNVVRGNKGYNPTGPQTAPAVPATTVALTNPFTFDCTVFITAGAGSTTVVAVGGTTAMTIAASGIGTVRLPAGQTITLTYTSAPTWTWFGD